MFDNPSKRREFIAALRTGKISPTVLQKAMASVNSFADCKVDEISWALSHNLPQIQQFGQSVLVIMKDPNKGKMLVELYQKEQNPARIEQLAQALADSHLDDVTNQLSVMVNDRQPETRKKAMALLVRIEDWPRQKNLVRALIGDPVDDISVTMLTHVVRAAPRLYLREVRAAAHNDNEELRTLCLKTLVSMNNVKMADVLVARLGKEKGDLQKSLFGALAVFIKQDPASMTEHIMQAIADPDDGIRQTALNLMTKLPDQPAAFRRLLVFCEGLSANVRNGIYEELARNAEAFVDLVLNLFKTEKDPALRLAAMNLAKVLKHQRLAPVFLHEMKNPDWMVRYAAMQVLGEMKSQQALPALVEALNSDAAMAAVQALDKYRDIRLAKPFFQKLPAAVESEQMEILKALQNIGDTRLLPTLAKFLDSNAPKGKAKLFCAETLMEMCKATNTKVPPRVTQIYDQLREKTMNDLPDLGLRLSED